jgi:FimV-like protein
MRAWTHLLLIAPVANNWMWTDDMPRLTALIGLKWQALTPWHTQFLSTAPVQPEAVMQQQQAQGILTMQLNSAQTELQLRLNTSSYTAQTNLNLTVPSQSLDMPQKILDTLANMITDWLVQQLNVQPDIPLDQYTPLPLPEQLAFVALVLHGCLDKAAVDTQMTTWLGKMPDAHVLHRVQGERCQQARQYAQAIQHFQLAIKFTPAALVWQRSKDATLAGLCAILAGQAGLGQQWMEAAIKWAPLLPAPQLHLGLTLESQGKVPEAIGYLLTYRELVPDDSRALYALARLFAMQQNWPQVVAQYEALLTLVEPDTWLHCDLASAYLQMDEPDKARQWFETVINTAPADHPAVEMAKLAIGMDVII